MESTSNKLKEQEEKPVTVEELTSDQLGLVAGGSVLEIEGN